MSATVDADLAAATRTLGTPAEKISGEILDEEIVEESTEPVEEPTAKPTVKPSKAHRRKSAARHRMKRDLLRVVERYKRGSVSLRGRYADGQRAARHFMYLLTSGTAVAVFFTAGFAVEGWELMLGLGAAFAVFEWHGVAGVAASVAAVGLAARYVKHRSNRAAESE